MQLRRRDRYVVRAESFYGHEKMRIPAARGGGVDGSASISQ